MSVNLLKGASILKHVSLAVLVWSQFVFAFHASDHDILDEREHCAICVQFDRDDEALVTGQTASLPLVANRSVLTDAVASLPASVPSFFRARASP